MTVVFWFSYLRWHLDPNLGGEFLRAPEGNTMTMKGTPERQHSATEVGEIVGEKCLSLNAIAGVEDDSVVVFYLVLEGTLLRVFLDVGVLFIKVSNDEDMISELDESEEVVDLCSTYRLDREEITKATMKNGFFRLRFSSGKELIFEEQGDTTVFRQV